MTTIEPQALRRELLLKEALDDRLDQLVRQANGAARLLKGNDLMEVNQLRNLLNVAIRTGSLEVVINFIRYQIARNGRAWADSANFGQRVIADLRGPVRELAADAVAQAQARGAKDLQSEQVFTRLMQLYLGYLNRAFYYARRTKDFDGLQEHANG